MLEKKVLLGVAKDTDGILVIDKESKKGIKIPDEAVAQLTLIVWDLCDKLDHDGIVAKIVGDAAVTAEQRGMLDQFVRDSFEMFQKLGWAVPKAGVQESGPKKPAPPKKK